MAAPADAKSSMNATLQQLVTEPHPTKHVTTTTSTAAARDMTLIAINKGANSHLKPVDPSQQRLSDSVDAATMQQQAQLENQ